MSNLRKKCGNSKRVLYPTYNNYLRFNRVSCSLPPSSSLHNLLPQISDLWGKKSQKLGWYFSLILSLVYDNTARLQLCLLLSSSFHPPSLPPPWYQMLWISPIMQQLINNATTIGTVHAWNCSLICEIIVNTKLSLDVSPLKTLSLPSFLPAV